MEIFKILIQKENRQIPAISASIFSANPIKLKDKQKKINETISGNLLSNFETSQPEIGNPINELTGIASNKLPSSASLSWKNAFNVGIREAQVAKPKPAMKK